MPYFNIVAETNQNTVVRGRTAISPRPRWNRSLSVCSASRAISICRFTMRPT